MVRAAASGELDEVATRVHPIFNLEYPLSCPGVPDDVLDPQESWPDPDAYEVQAKELARMFVSNFDRFSESVPPEVSKAGPAAT
jgi:phosphoenolpyruvate carboxykinase (ATP)